MINDIIKILNLKGYDIDILKSYLEDSLSNKIKLHIYLNKRDLKCPYCGSNSKLKEYRIKELKHSVFIDVECSLFFHNRRMVCTECDKTFMENNPFCFEGHKADIETEISILNQLKDYKMTFKKLSDLYHISITTIVRIFDRRIQLPRHSFGQWVSMDEFYSRKISSSGYCLTFYDPIHKTILDVLPSRHKRVLIDYLSKIPLLERKRVKYISINMWHTYKEMAQIAFPNAIICVDSFHVIKHLNDAFNQMRLRVQKRFSHLKGDLNSYYWLYKKYNKFLLRNYSNIYSGLIKVNRYGMMLDKYQIRGCMLSLDDELRLAYELKEEYHSFNLSASIDDAKNRLLELIDKFKASKIKEFYPFIRTIKNWFDEIINSFNRINGHRISNGPMERTNRTIKQLFYNGFGFTNFERTRKRIIYISNSNTPILGVPEK